MKASPVSGMWIEKKLYHDRPLKQFTNHQKTPQNCHSTSTLQPWTSVSPSSSLFAWEISSSNQPSYCYDNESWLCLLPVHICAIIKSQTSSLHTVKVQKSNFMLTSPLKRSGEKAPEDLTIAHCWKRFSMQNFSCLIITTSLLLLLLPLSFSGKMRFVLKLIMLTEHKKLILIVQKKTREGDEEKTGKSLDIRACTTKRRKTNGKSLIAGWRSGRDD